MRCLTASAAGADAAAPGGKRRSEQVVQRMGRSSLLKNGDKGNAGMKHSNPSRQGVGCSLHHRRKECLCPSTRPPPNRRGPARFAEMWRILPLIFILYVIAYLDRANLGNAWLQMQYMPGFDPQVLGWGAGIFFAGYQLLEIPGALTRRTLERTQMVPRILVTWGACSMGMALVTTPWQFYLARFLLGLAEAGFFPGLIIYFTHWFPRADRGRALASMVLAVPVSLTVGAWVSGALLKCELVRFSRLAMAVPGGRSAGGANGRGRAVPPNGSAGAGQVAERGRAGVAGGNAGGGSPTGQAGRRRDAAPGAAPAHGLAARAGHLRGQHGRLRLGLLAAQGRQDAFEGSRWRGRRRPARRFSAGRASFISAASPAFGCRASRPTEPASGNGTAPRAWR